MSENWERYRQPYRYKSKLVAGGTVDRVKELKAEGKTFEQIGNIIEKNKTTSFTNLLQSGCKGLIKVL